MLAISTNQVRLVTPYIGLAGEAEPYVSLSSLTNALDFRVEQSRCRLILSVKRFSGGGPDGEIELPALVGGFPPYPPATVSQAGAVSRRDASEPARDRRGDFSRLTARFDAKDEFVVSGMLYFGPASITTYIANAPDELQLAVLKNHGLRAHEITIGNQRSRVYIAVTRELLVDGVWAKLFDQ
jgi:hypothetical protein